MYRAHFGLDEPPFRITPNTGFFFDGGRRGPTLEALLFAVQHDEGITKLSGEVGSGKTMLCRMLLSRLPAEVDTIYLANPTLGPDDLLRLVAEELSIDAPSDNPGVRLIEIQKDLVARFAAGRRVVALVDEAHAMPAASLEQIRLLSNLETDEHKLLQIVLFGQPELDELLKRSGMRQLRDRITQHFRLAPLSPGEVGEYLRFRLRTAGHRGPDLFARSAVRLLARASGGLSRRINVLADKALLSAYSQGADQVRRQHVAEAIRDSEYPLPGRDGSLPALAGGVSLAVLAVAGWLFAGYPSAPRTILAEESPPAPVAMPRPSERSPRAETPLDPAPPAPEPHPALPVATLPAPPAPVVSIEAETMAAMAQAHAPGTEPPPAPPESVAPNRPEAAPGQPEPTTSDGAPPPLRLGPLALPLQADTARWVAETPADHWFIQLRTVDGARAEDIDRFVAQLDDTIDREQLRIYVRDLGWGARVGIIFGDFARRDAAMRAMAALPAGLRSDGIYPRQVKGLR